MLKPVVPWTPVVSMRVAREIVRLARARGASRHALEDARATVDALYARPPKVVPGRLMAAGLDREAAVEIVIDALARVYQNFEPEYYCDVCHEHTPQKYVIMHLMHDDA